MTEHEPHPLDGLRERFPTALSASPGRERMPFPMFGFECGPGWLELLVPALEYMEQHGIRVDQVKEKFGGLRLYPDRYDEALQCLLEVIETRSFQTCERCGEPGRPSGNEHGWIKTLCEKHHVQRRMDRERFNREFRARRK